MIGSYGSMQTLSWKKGKRKENGKEGKKQRMARRGEKKGKRKCHEMTRREKEKGMLWLDHMQTLFWKKKKRKGNGKEGGKRGNGKEGKKKGNGHGGTKKKEWNNWIICIHANIVLKEEKKKREWQGGKKRKGNCKEGQRKRNEMTRTNTEKGMQWLDNMDPCKHLSFFLSLVSNTQLNLRTKWVVKHCSARITGWRRLIGSLKLQIIFHKRATKYRSLLWKMTYKDKGSYESSPPCMWCRRLWGGYGQ